MACDSWGSHAHHRRVCCLEWLDSRGKSRAMEAVESIRNSLLFCRKLCQEPVADEKHFVSCLENHDIVVFLTQPWNRTIWTVQAMVLPAMCKHILIPAQSSFVKVVHCTGSTRDIFMHSYHQMLLFLHLCKPYSLGPLSYGQPLQMML